MSHFFVFEGCTGSGKSTQINLLKEKYPTALYTFLPGGTKVGDQLRTCLFENADNADPLTQLYTVHASHWQNYLENIGPALENKQTVFCDRFQLSTYVHQVHEPNRSDVMDHYLETVAQFMNEGLQPHYIFMDIEPSISLGRIEGRDNNDVFDEKNLAYHEQIYAGYKQALAELGVQYTIIDAAQELEVVTNAVYKAVEEVINEQDKIEE